MISIENEKIIIGLEIHITPNTKKKVFNNNNVFSESLNSSNNLPNEIGSWELGYLGTLPLLNEEVLEKTIILCLAFNCKLSEKIIFDRKIYSYFDLAKGFQITQERDPIGKNGFFKVFLDNGLKREISINRIQIEEDTAKSSYEKDKVFLDFRRSGNPLIEVVTGPDFRNINEALSFAKQLRTLLSYLGISDAKMEEGQFRIDLNFSIDFNNGDYKTPRYEVKNLNSFKNMKNSFIQELEKHRKNFVSNFPNSEFELYSQTLGYDEIKQKTFVQREKTSYSYISEYNIVPIHLEKKYVNALSKKMPVLPSFILDKTNFNNKEILIENLFFLNFIKLLLDEKIDFSKEVNKIPSFISNYLKPIFLSIQRKNIIKRKEIKKIWGVFKFWEEGKIEKKKLKYFIEKCFQKNIVFFEIEKEIISLKKEILKFEEIEFKIEEILKDEINKKKIEKISFDEKKISSMIFGILKREFPKKIILLSDVEKMSLEIKKLFDN